MNLIEYKYLPKKLNDIIIPNKEEIIKTVYNQIKIKNLNLLIIGSHYTLKSNLITLIVNEYYNNLNVYNYNDYILNIDCFNDINLSNTNNDIKTFCKSNTTHKKFLIIDNFDIINEGNQQYLKILIDTCKNTFFIFGCENTNKINEIIQTRVTPIYFHDLKKENYREIIEMISLKEDIPVNIDILLGYSNITPYFIYNLFNKLKLLNKTQIDVPFHYSILDEYMESIYKNNVKNATNILFSLYDKGYSLLDIYHFMYDYFKLSADINKYKCISITSELIGSPNIELHECDLGSYNNSTITDDKIENIPFLYQLITDTGYFYINGLKVKDYNYGIDKYISINL